MFFHFPDLITPTLRLYTPFFSEVTQTPQSDLCYVNVELFNLSL